jgi:hypothetical protein
MPLQPSLSQAHREYPSYALNVLVLSWFCFVSALAGGMLGALVTVRLLIPRAPSLWQLLRIVLSRGLPLLVCSLAAISSPGVPASPSPAGNTVTEGGVTCRRCVQERSGTWARASAPAHLGGISAAGAVLSAPAGCQRERCL